MEIVNGKEFPWGYTGKNYQFYETKALRKILEFVLVQGCDSLFEGAVGSGFFPTMLRGGGYKGKYLGSDFCKKFLNEARTNNPKEKFIKVDLLKKIPLEDDAFDISVVHDGLNYIYPYENTFKELKRITKRYVVITLCHILREKQDIGYIFPQPKGHRWHGNHYSAKEWYATLKKCGYKIVNDCIINDVIELTGKKSQHQLFILQV